MPRPILQSITSTNTSPALREPQARASTNLTTQAIDARLREKRSPAYLAAVAKLDAGGHTLAPGAFQEIFAAIQAEFPELPLESLPLGLVSKCYLGEPYEVHRVDFSGSILAHYRRRESLPGIFEKARALAMHPNYLVIEVFPHSIRAVRADGTVTVTELADD